MFFSGRYGEPGPGVDPEAPEKTGVARLWEIVQLEAVTLVKLNLVFLVTCLPVVTIPAAVYAMNQTVRRMVLDQPVDCFWHYRQAFTGSWRRAYAAFFLTAVPLVVSGTGIWFYLSRAGENPLFFAPFLLCSTAFLVVLMASVYLYGLLSTGLKVGESVRLALILGIGRPLRAALALLCYYGLTIFAILQFPISGLYLLLLGFSVPCLLGNFYLRTVLKRQTDAMGGEGGGVPASKP